MRPSDEVTARFWAKVNKTQTCWLWTASTTGTQYATGGGYSQFVADGKHYRGHRFAYELLVGPIPEGLHLDHLCRVRICVNPAHLEPVTPQENQRRGLGLGVVNAAKDHCPQGHPYAGDNLYLYANGNRRCRTCGREQAAARKRRGQGSAS